MISCTNCGSEVPPNKSICSNCGQTVGTNVTWPPAPSNAFVPPIPDYGKLITGKRWGDLILGFMACWPLLFLSVLGLAVGLGIYYYIRITYPTFARGFGFGLLAMILVDLGIFVICLRDIGAAFARSHPPP